MGGMRSVADPAAKSHWVVVSLVSRAYDVRTA